MQLLLLLILMGLMHSARTFAPPPGVGSRAGGVALAVGFVLLAGLFTGNLFKRIGLPQLTGFLALGLLTGPQGLALLTNEMLSELRIFDGVAIALIALTAGTEMDFRTMRPLLRGIAWISGVAVLGTVLLLAVVAYLLRGWLPFMAGLTQPQLIAVCVVLGVTMAAQSPAVAVALRNELRADGPLVRTVLGVVVVSDLVIILLFAGASTVARILLGSASADGSPLGVAAWEIFGSLAAGVIIGVLIALCVRTLDASGGIFIILSGFLIAEVGQRVHLDPLLIALASGMLIRNFTSLADRVHSFLEDSALPVYIGFFAVAGAAIHLDALAVVGVPAAVFVIVRAVGFLGGTRIATHLAQSPEPVKRFGGFGLLPQAGLALALALLFARSYPNFGVEASALIFGIVGINEMLAPVLYKWALVKSGEAGQLATPAEESNAAIGDVAYSTE
jgi:Kef-type K+ transport system membrane component KefB